jgi:hypothetical protein
LFELVQLRPIDQPSDHLTHIVWAAQARRYRAIELSRVIVGIACRLRWMRGARRTQAGHDAARNGQSMSVILSVVVADA